MKNISQFSKSEKKRGIRVKILRTVLTLVLITLIGLGIITSYLNYQNTFTTLEKSMTEAVELAAERVEWELTAYKRVVIDLGTIARMSNDSYTDQDKQDLIDQKVKEYNLARGKLISADGISHIDGTDYNDREYFKKSM